MYSTDHAAGILFFHSVFCFFVVGFFLQSNIDLLLSFQTTMLVLIM